MYIKKQLLTNEWYCLQKRDENIIDQENVKADKLYK